MFSRDLGCRFRVECVVSLKSWGTWGGCVRVGGVGDEVGEEGIGCFLFCVEGFGFYLKGNRELWKDFM